MLASGRFLTILPIEMLRHPTEKAWLRQVAVDLRDSARPVASITLKKRRGQTVPAGQPRKCQGVVIGPAKMARLGPACPENSITFAAPNALAMGAVSDALARMAAEPSGGSPEEFGWFVKSQIAHWDKIVRAGIRLPNQQ